ncbi:MAG: GNAT family N-acetyltransferase [Sphingomonadales bacterium]
MSKTVTIRECLEDEMEAVTAIYARQVEKGTGSFEITPPGEAEMKDRRARVLALGLPYLVAVSGEKVVGFAYAQTHKPRAAYDYTVESSVYVADNMRRAGVGRKLMAELARRCEAAGKRQMVAVVGDSENTASIALHKSVGFRRVGQFEKVGFKHGRWLDIVLMQRALGNGAKSPPEM